MGHYGADDKQPAPREGTVPGTELSASAERVKNTVRGAREARGQDGIKRFGLLQCIPDFDDSALRYFILSINSFQDAFELEFVPYDDQDRFLQPLLTSESVDRPTSGGMLEFWDRENSLFQQVANDYDQPEEPPHYYQIISMAQFRDNYFQTSNGFLSIVALGGWRRSMAPPSILEFIQIFVLRSALFALVPELTSHLGTRGCVMDFSAKLSDVRQHVLLGYICHECESTIKRRYPNLVPELREFLSKRWLGDPANPASPAAVVSKLKHDLFITKGLEPSLLERARMTLIQEGFKQIPTIIGLIVTAIVISLLGVVTAVTLTSNGSNPSPTPTPINKTFPSSPVPSPSSPVPSAFQTP